MFNRCEIVYKSKEICPKIPKTFFQQATCINPNLKKLRKKIYIDIKEKC